MKCVPPLLGCSSLEQWVLSFQLSSGFSGHGSSSTGLFGSKAHHQFHGTIALNWIGDLNHQLVKTTTLIEKGNTMSHSSPQPGKLGEKQMTQLGSSPFLLFTAPSSPETTQCASLASTRASQSFQKKVYLPISLLLCLHALSPYPFSAPAGREDGNTHGLPPASRNILATILSYLELFLVFNFAADTKLSFKWILPSS